MAEVLNNYLASGFIIEDTYNNQEILPAQSILIPLSHWKD